MLLPVLSNLFYSKLCIEDEELGATLRCRSRPDAVSAKSALVCGRVDW